MIIINKDLFKETALLILLKLFSHFLCTNSSQPNLNPEPASKHVSAENCRPGEFITCLFTFVQSQVTFLLHTTTTASIIVGENRKLVTTISMYRRRHETPNIQDLLSLPFQSDVHLHGSNVDTKCPCIQSIFKKERIYLTADELERYGTYLQVRETFILPYQNHFNCYTLFEVVTQKKIGLFSFHQLFATILFPTFCFVNQSTYISLPLKVQEYIS